MNFERLVYPDYRGIVQAASDFSEPLSRIRPTLSDESKGRQSENSEDKP